VTVEEIPSGLSGESGSREKPKTKEVTMEIEIDIKVYCFECGKELEAVYYAAGERGDPSIGYAHENRLIVCPCGRRLEDAMEEGREEIRGDDNA